jgi:hypothetical protein
VISKCVAIIMWETVCGSRASCWGEQYVWTACHALVTLHMVYEY